MNLLSRTQSKKNPIFIQLKEYQGKRLFDIRRFFLESNSGEYKPTQKGISLNKDNFLHVIQAIEENKDQVSAWFEINNKEITKENFKNKVESDCAEQEYAKEEIRLKKRQVKAEKFKERRYPFPYRYEANGALHLIKENSEHPLHLKIRQILEETPSDNNLSKQIYEVLQAIFFSYFVAMDRAERGSKEGYINRKNFEQEWDQALRTQILQYNIKEHNRNE